MTVAPLTRPAGGHRTREVLARHAPAAAVALTAAALAWSVWAEGRTHRVEMKDVAFAPARVTVHAGDSAAWDNRDIVAHTATSEGGGFDVDISAGGKGSAVMTRPGTFDYVCRYHPNMTGRIVVEP